MRHLSAFPHYRRLRGGTDAYVPGLTIDQYALIHLCAGALAGGRSAGSAAMDAKLARDELFEGVEADSEAVIRDTEAALAEALQAECAHANADTFYSQAKNRFMRWCADCGETVDVNDEVLGSLAGRMPPLSDDALAAAHDACDPLSERVSPFPAHMESGIAKALDRIGNGPTFAEVTATQGERSEPARDFSGCAHIPERRVSEIPADYEYPLGAIATRCALCKEVRIAPHDGISTQRSLREIDALFRKGVKHVRPA